MTRTILPEITREINQEIAIEDLQETETETEYMKIEAAVEREAMKMTGRRGPAMADKADPEVVARSP